METILVVGGAGYIGSHTVRRLLNSGLKVVVVDDLSTGIQSALPESVDFVRCSILDRENLRNIFIKYKFSSVFHFAAKLSVPESVEKPLFYYDNNVIGSINILQFCDEFKVNNFIFSSTAAVYGDVGSGTVVETDQCKPKSPYGLSKKIVEELLLNFSAVRPDFKCKILRYFNVAGAELDSSNGPRNLDAGQLIINLCKSALGDKKVQIYGKQFKTKDGTAVRDYIHVVDLAEAHCSAYRALQESGVQSGIWNCGYGQGFSVAEVINTFERINQVKFNVEYCPPRAGDPEQVVAENKKILAETDWQPKFDSLEVICKSTFDWMRSGALRVI